MDKKIAIDRNSSIPIHQQIKSQIEQMIYDNILPEGKRLPPSRQLAKSLGVNRSTIVAVYDELIATDLLDARVGSGTRVAMRRNIPGGGSSSSQINWSEVFNITPRYEQESLIRDSMSICAQPGMIMFAAGVPSPKTHPIQDFREIMDHELGSGQTSLFDLMPSAGYAPLMERIAQETISRADPARSDEILITSGSIQGLALVTKVFIQPDDLVVVENPTFFGALQSFTAARARLLFVPTDNEGMQVDVLEKLLTRHRPKLIYTIPTYQNPGGTVMSLTRRRKLLDLVHRQSVPLVEDDPYSRIYFGDVPPPSLKMLDRFNHVIYLSSFSKILFPGFRVGWVTAPRPVADRLSQAKLLMDLHTNAPGQVMIHRYLQEGRLDGHLQRVRADYSRRAELMDQSLRRHTRGLISWQPPSGGYYFWCHIDAAVSSRSLMLELFHDKVAILPGEVFYPGSEGSHWFRLNFTFPPMDQIEPGIERIGSALKRMLHHNRSFPGSDAGKSFPLV